MSFAFLLLALSIGQDKLLAEANGKSLQTCLLNMRHFRKISGKYPCSLHR